MNTAIDIRGLDGTGRNYTAWLLRENFKVDVGPPGGTDATDYIGDRVYLICVRSPYSWVAEKLRGYNAHTQDVTRRLVACWNDGTRKGCAHQRSANMKRESAALILQYEAYAEYGYHNVLDRIRAKWALRPARKPYMDILRVIGPDVTITEATHDRQYEIDRRYMADLAADTRRIIQEETDLGVLTGAGYRAL